MLDLSKINNNQFIVQNLILAEQYQGADIFYVPENGDIKEFVKNPLVKQKVQTITIPPRLVLIGQKIITMKYYTELKKSISKVGAFRFSKVPEKKYDYKKSNLIDFSFYTPKVYAFSNVSNITSVYKIFMDFMSQISKDLEANAEKNTSKQVKESKNYSGRPKVLVIDIDMTKDKTGFITNMEYYLKHTNYQINQLAFDRVLFKVGKNYYNVGWKDKEKDKEFTKISKSNWRRVLDLSTSNSTKEFEESLKAKTITVPIFENPIKEVKVLKDITKEYQKINKHTNNEIKAKEMVQLLNSKELKDLKGNSIEDKLLNLILLDKFMTQEEFKNIDMFKNTKLEELKEKLSDNEDVSKNKKEDLLDTAEKENYEEIITEHKKVNNGDIEEDSLILHENNEVFKAKKLVGLDIFKNYNRQSAELLENLDKNMYDLFKNLEDKDLDLKVHKIDSEIVDTKADRYKKYKIRISHKYGKTFNKPYTVYVNAPVPTDGKYIKNAGNNYIMVNQLFNKPIVKVEDNLCRVYTHFNTTSVKLKFIKANLEQIEKEFLYTFTSVKTSSIKTEYEKITDEVIEKLQGFVSTKELSSFIYEYIYIKKGKKEYIFDFRNPVGDTLEFLIVKEDGKVVERHKIVKDLIFSTINGETNSQEKEFLNELLLHKYNSIIKEEFGQDLIKKSKSSKPHFSARILGKEIPVAVLLTLVYPWDKALNKMSLKYSVQDKKIKGEDVINIPALDESKNRIYVSVYPKTLKQKLLATGFTIYRTNETVFPGTNSSEFYLGICKDKHGVIGINKIVESIPKIVDFTTKEILQEMNISDNIMDIYSDVIPNMLLNHKILPDPNNLANYRIRMAETIAHIGYKQLNAAITELKRKKNFEGEKLFLRPDFIMKNLLEAGVFQQTKTINPLEELMLGTKTIKTGIGNVKKEQVTLSRRDLNPSYFGTISPTATNEYNTIGSNQTLANGASLGKHGIINVKPFNNNQNPFEMLSVIESLTPFFEYDDTTRRVMGNQQTGQFTQIKKPDQPLVQTGFESYIPHLVSNRFAKKSKIDGRVKFVNGNILIEGKDGSQDFHSIQPIKARTKRGVFIPNEYTSMVKDGQKVKKGEILAATDSLKSGKLAIGKNIVVAETGYNGKNYEDGWAISNDLKEKFTNSYLEKVIIPFTLKEKIINLNIQKGESSAGSVLFESINKEFNHDFIEKSKTMFGLVEKGQTNVYYSPGGKITDIVVKLNTNKVDNKILVLRKDMKRLESEQNHCKIISEKYSDPKEQEQVYLDCVASIENLESLKVGGHKIGGLEPDGGFIEVYIEKENPINYGSKFTLANTGGKGTVQYIIPDGKAPEATKSGLRIDFLAASLSIIKRKNPSIFFMMYLGKCVYFMNEQAKDMLNTHKMSEIEDYIIGAYQYIDVTPNKEIVQQAKDFFKKPEAELRKIISTTSISKPVFPAIKQPFQNKITMKDIKELAKYLGVPLKEKIHVKEGDYITTREVPVGILPVYLLEHFPKAQGSARGSQYVSRNVITGQGQSGTKDRQGSNKLGMYDLYSLLTFKPYNLIKEMHALKSDSRTKTQIHRDIYRNNKIPSIADLDVTTQTKDWFDAMYIASGLESGY